MATNGKATNLPEPREPRAHTAITSIQTRIEPRKKEVETAETILQLFSMQAVQETEHPALPNESLTQAELYPIRQAFKPEHITALRLLGIAIGRSKRALDLQTDDLIASDTEIQKIQVILPELFCCRKLGDGFGAVINGLICAFENLGGDSMNSKQIRALHEVLYDLRERPFLSSDDADEELDAIEAAGLETTPAELMDLLSSESSIR
jgi:hypothetical protein